MAESDTSLDARLVDLGPRLSFPATPDLGASVGAHLEAHPRRRPWSGLTVWGPRRAAAFAMLAVALVAAAVLGVSPTARRAVAGWLGLPGVRITIAPRPSPTDLGHNLNLGRRVSLAEARTEVSFDLRLPRGLGPPDEIYVARDVVGGRASLVYRSRAGIPSTPETGVGLLITQFEGRLEQDLMQKVVGSGTQVRPLAVGRFRGYWVSGPPHFLVYLDDVGNVVEDSVRTAGDALLWQEGPVTLRLETALPLRRALEIARGMR